MAAALVSVPMSRLSDRFPRHSDGPFGTELVFTRSNTLDGQEALAKQAVEAARAAGAQYADVRITRIVFLNYNIYNAWMWNVEEIGVGVRALVQGAWGFAAAPVRDEAEITQLSRNAVAQAKVNARGVTKKFEWGQTPIARGRWQTPVSVDAFTVPIEEIDATMRYWDRCAKKVGVKIDPMGSGVHFSRQERTVATSDGSCFSQTLFESGGNIILIPFGMSPGPGLIGSDLNNVKIPIRGIEPTGRGWDLFLEPNIIEQIQSAPETIREVALLGKHAKPAIVGQYTLVCDGKTMAAMLEATLGVATQLDRALGYEANAGGTSFLDDPLAMLGVFKVGSPFVNVTTNRSAPRQLATVKWDDEGVVPSETQLVKDGVLVDFQTTRELATWLKSYYAKVGKPVQSNGCAAAQSALYVTMQHMPNLALDAGTASASVADLVTGVKDGILIEEGGVAQVDFQARTGLLGGGRWREIKNGQLGPMLVNGAVLFNTIEFWKNITAIGGPSTQGVVSMTQYPFSGSVKGQPFQAASHSAQGIAATIAKQAVIDPMRRA
jgi:TldD protein